MSRNTSRAEQASVFVCLFLKVYSRRPSKYEAFVDDKTEWISDRFFTQQRLAGVNPMSLRRVTLEAGKHSFKHCIPDRTFTVASFSSFRKILTIVELLFNFRVEVNQYNLKRRNGLDGVAKRWLFAGSCIFARCKTK